MYCYIERREQENCEQSKLCWWLSASVPKSKGRVREKSPLEINGKIKGGWNPFFSQNSFWHGVNRTSNGTGMGVNEHTIFCVCHLYEVDYFVKCAYSPRAYQKSSNWYLFGAGAAIASCASLCCLRKTIDFFLTQSFHLALSSSFSLCCSPCCDFCVSLLVQYSHLCQSPYNGYTTHFVWGLLEYCHNCFDDGGYAINFLF